MKNKTSPTLYSESTTESVLEWHDRRADERLWLLTRTDLKPGLLIIRHAGSSIWHKGASIARKNSDLYGVELVTAGNMRFIQDGKEYIVEPGTAFIKRRGGNHYYEPGPAGFAHKRFVRLDGTIIETIIGELGIEQTDVCHLTRPVDFAALQKKAIILLRNQPQGYRTQLSLLAFEIVLFLAQDISDTAYPPALSAAIEYMRRNVHRKITVSELSWVAGVSFTQFFRLFNRYLGETPLTYFNAMKIKRAAELLRHTLMPIKEIAFNLGYEENTYFTNQFRKIMGVSPREFRKRM
jgi:AraC-like DNA-binding protein